MKNTIAFLIVLLCFHLGTVVAQSTKDELPVRGLAIAAPKTNEV